MCFTLLDEKEHAAIGHNAIVSFVMEDDIEIIKKAINDHDRDFALFYKSLNSMLE